MAATLRYFTAGALVLLLSRAAAAQCAGPANRWVDIWGAMPQPLQGSDLPYDVFNGTTAILADATVRQTVLVTQDADTIRLQFSNAYSTSDLPLTSVYLAVPGTGQVGDGTVNTGTLCEVTFAGGYSNYTIPPGAVAFTDPLAFPIKVQSALSVTAYLQQGQTVGQGGTHVVTGHAGSHTETFFAAGNFVTAANFADSTVQSINLHWYFLSTVEAYLPASSGALVVVGDDSEDGYGTADDSNTRWTDMLLRRMQNDTSTRNISVIAEAAAGNRLLYDSPSSSDGGPNGLARLDAGVISHSGVKYTLIHLGANDIAQTGADLATQQQLSRRIVAAYEQIIVRLHRFGIPVLGGTIAPFGGSHYSDPNREASRQTVNAWIRQSGRFEGVVDFDAAVRDPSNLTQLNPAFDSGDHAHLNLKGYNASAYAVSLTAFSKLACGAWANIV